MYLQELNSFHLDRLQAEPHILFENKQQIQEEIKNLAFSNYKTFIRTAQCSREIYSDFSIIESRLDQLISKLPEFTSSCENFTKNIQSINASRRSNNLTLQKHNQLLEILEISQLMDTCVRNEYYEEALDLASYVKRLDKKFSNSIPIIQQIVDDCNKSLNLMLKQLLQQLKANLQFNQCLKIIGIIRRLEVFSESELRYRNFINMNKKLGFFSKYTTINYNQKLRNKTLKLTKKRLGFVLTLLLAQLKIKIKIYRLQVFPKFKLDKVR